MLSRNEQLTAVISEAADAKTSSNPEEWNPENPTQGHCAVAALLVQEMKGGDILRASLEGTEFAYMHSHYWNRLPDGSELDVTEAQFQGRRPDLQGEIRSREYLLANAGTRYRHLMLRIEVLMALNKHRLILDSVKDLLDEVARPLEDLVGYRKTCQDPHQTTEQSIASKAEVPIESAIIYLVALQQYLRERNISLDTLVDEEPGLEVTFSKNGHH